MTPIEASILQTILYANVFNFPLRIDELQRYLISDNPCTLSDIEEALLDSEPLQNYLHQEDGYICIKANKDSIRIRQEREKISKAVWQDALFYGRLLSQIPFVRMVGLTGALAVRNPSSSDDDYDYLLVTKPGRVWLARAFAILMVRIVRFLGRELCPNYVLAEDGLVQSRQDLYMAHEMAQMRPIYGAESYQQMLDENPWVQDYLANALPFETPVDKPRRLRKLLEWTLQGRVGDWLEKWEYQRKLDKFMPKVNQVESSAEIRRNSVKGHFQDHGMPVLMRYEELLYEYGLLEDIEELAGD